MKIIDDDSGLGHAAALDWRGLGEAGPLTSTTCTPRPYCAVCAPDVAAVIAHLHTRYPSSPLYAVGFSLGAGMLLRHLGDTGGACLLRAAMVVSPAIDIRAGYKYMARGLRPLYFPVIIFPLVHYLWRHRAELRTGPTPLHFWSVLRSALCGANGMDEHVYSYLWGLPGGKEEYWDRGSAIHVLHRIRRTTLVVHSEDDPICPVGAMPLEDMAANPHLITAITRHGGHMGYTAGLSPLKWTWTDRLLVHFLRHFESLPTHAESPKATGAGHADPCASDAGSSLPSSPHAADTPVVPIISVPSRLWRSEVRCHYLGIGFVAIGVPAVSRVILYTAGVWPCVSAHSQRRANYKKERTQTRDSPGERTDTAKSHSRRPNRRYHRKKIMQTEPKNTPHRGHRNQRHT